MMAEAICDVVCTFLWYELIDFAGVQSETTKASMLHNHISL